MPDYSDAVRERLRDAGCRFDRYGKVITKSGYVRGRGAQLSIDNRIKSRHTANGIMKQAGLPKAF